MEFWLEVFSIVAAIALVVQVVILGALFFELKRTTEKVNKLVGDMQTRVGPILSRVQLLLDDTQPRISGDGCGCFAYGVPGAWAGAENGPGVDRGLGPVARTVDPC